MIKFDFNTYTQKYLKDEDYTNIFNQIKNDFLTKGEMKGWYDLDFHLEEIETTASYIKENADVFVVIGIGGSYLGSKAIIDAFSPNFKKTNPEIIFAGYNLSSRYLTELLEYIKGKRIVINVISKSGGTIEPNVAFNKIYEYMASVYNEEELKHRVIVTTDSEKSKLLDLANQKGFQKFAIPSNVGGRFSVLTPVGLLPISVAGINIRKLLEGAKDSKNNLADAYTYAKIRDIFYKNGKCIESFVVYDEKLYFFTEWLKQLFAETQGKNNKGILPISTVNTRDLHSLGQYMQDGEDIVFETNLYIANSSKLFIKEYNKDLTEIELDALKSVCESHYNGHTPSIVITMDELNEYNIGYLVFFYFVSSMLGAYLLGVNYYDQPGVNGYKDILKERLVNEINE